jgi:hypothetical protein
MRLARALVGAVILALFALSVGSAGWAATSAPRKSSAPHVSAPAKASTSSQQTSTIASSPTATPTSEPGKLVDPATADFSWKLWVSALALLAIALLFFISWRREKNAAATERDLEAIRITYGFLLIVASLVLIFGVVILTVNVFRPPQIQATDTLALIASVTGVVGTLIAAFFGVQAAGAGRSQALATLDKMQSQNQTPAAENKMDPASGPHVGNTRTSITGNGFTGASAVNFGDVPGSNFEFVNDGMVRATAPRAPDGKDSADVAVIFKGATPPNQAVGTFYYYTIEPNEAGVQIRGAGLKTASMVRFGSEQAPKFTVDSKGYLNVTYPQRPDGVDPGSVVDVVVVYPVSTPTNKTNIGKFKWPGRPTITAVGATTPQSTQVTVTGTGFVQGLSGTVDGAQRPAQFVDAQTAILTLPTGLQTGSQLTIVITNPASGGDSEPHTLTIS